MQVHAKVAVEAAELGRREDGSAAENRLTVTLVCLILIDDLQAIQ